MIHHETSKRDSAGKSRLCPIITPGFGFRRGVPIGYAPSPMSFPLRRLIDSVIAVLVKPCYRGTGVMVAVPRQLQADDRVYLDIQLR
jgi:hypothetical protein